MPLIVLLAVLVAVTSPTQSRQRGVRAPDRDREIVRVEEDLTTVPAGTVVHLCVRDLPCVTDVARAGNNSNSQSVDLRLPAGVSAMDANGWPLRVYATAHETRFGARTRIAYHVSIDPPCECAGDYAYVKLAMQRPRH